MSTRVRPTTNQATAAVVAGHRMAGMEPTATDLDLGRRMYEGEISADDAVHQAIIAALADK